MFSTEFEIKVKKPFRLDFTVWVLRRRSKNIVDRFDEGVYSRLFNLKNQPILVNVTQPNGKDKPTILKLKLLSEKNISKQQIAQIKFLIIKMLGLNVDLSQFYKISKEDSILENLAQQFYGMRPTRYPTIFEALINAVACQQVSLDAGIAVLNRLIETYGKNLTFENKTYYAFPAPEDLLNVEDFDLRKIGFSHQKIKTIKKLVYSILNNEINLELLDSADNTHILQALQKLHGIGRWSAEYVLLRGFGRLDVFPGDDVGGQNNLMKLYNLNKRPSYEQLKKQIINISPYEGLIYFHLLLNKLYAKNIIF